MLCYTTHKLKQQLCVRKTDSIKWQLNHALVNKFAGNFVNTERDFHGVGLGDRDLVRGVDGSIVIQRVGG